MSPKVIKRLLILLTVICCTSFVAAHQHSHGNHHGHAHDHHGHSHDEPASFKYSKQANEAIKKVEENHGHEHDHNDHHHHHHDDDHHHHHHEEELPRALPTKTSG